MSRMDVKPFERMPQFSERTLLVGKRMKNRSTVSELFERMSQYFERMLMCLERICKPIELFERIFLGVRTDDERITNGLPVRTDNR